VEIEEQTEVAPPERDLTRTERELTRKQARFVIEYARLGPGEPNRLAAVRAGYSESGSDVTASRLLADDKVKWALQDRYDQLSAAASITPEFVLREWLMIAKADPTEIIRAEVVPCKHCWGIDHLYQWTDFEYAEATRAALAHRCHHLCEQPCRRREPPPMLGGLGYDHHRDPNLKCPKCEGHGDERLRVMDMRKASPSARKLIAGVKKTKEGIEIKFRDQTDAIKNLATWLGMLVTRGELSGPGGGPIPVSNEGTGPVLTVKDLTTDQIAQILLRPGGPLRPEPLTIEANSV
jgi:phage terminase small subunit